MIPFGGKQDLRYRRALSALGTAVLGKGSVLVVSAASVPITDRYLGAEQYGLWITISTTIAMLAYLDIGIASAVTLNPAIRGHFKTGHRDWPET